MFGKKCTPLFFNYLVMARPDPPGDSHLRLVRPRSVRDDPNKPMNVIQKETWLALSTTPYKEIAY